MKIKSKELIWLEKIDKLVETDFCEDMMCHALPNSKPFTQGEAEQMAEIIGKTYTYSHRIHCSACSRNV